MTRETRYFQQQGSAVLLAIVGLVITSAAYTYIHQLGKNSEISGRHLLQRQDLNDFIEHIGKFVDCPTGIYDVSATQSCQYPIQLNLSAPVDLTSNSAVIDSGGTIITTARGSKYKVRAKCEVCTAYVGCGISVHLEVWTSTDSKGVNYDAASDSGGSWRVANKDNPLVSECIFQ